MAAKAMDPATRDKLIVGAMRSGMTREQASVLTDVSKHAFEEGMATVMRILDTCPPDLRAPGLASVLASFGTVMRDHFPEHWKAFVAHDDTHDAVIVLPGGPADA